MAKKTQGTGLLSLETILFNCREDLRSHASLNDKRDLLLTLVFLRFIGEKFEDEQQKLRQQCIDNNPHDAYQYLFSQPISLEVGTELTDK